MFEGMCGDLQVLASGRGVQEGVFGGQQGVYKEDALGWALSGELEGEWGLQVGQLHIGVCKEFPEVGLQGPRVHLNHQVSEEMLGP